MTEVIINQLKHIVGSQPNDVQQLISKLQHIISETELQRTMVKDSVTLLELYSENNNKEHLEGKLITTGFSDLDAEIGGFYPGELVVIGARPQMGKTQLLINLALHISQSQPLLYFTFDLSTFFLTSRIVSTLANISASEIIQKNLSPDEQQKIVKVETQLSQYKLYVNESLCSSISTFREICQKNIVEHNVSVIMIDYLQMMNSQKFRNNRELEVSYIVRELKKIAKENNVCVIVSSQLSRAVEMRTGNKRPILSDLRESGGIEQDADKVLFIHSPEYYGIIEDEDGNSTINVTELIVAKNRNGKPCSVKLLRNKNFTSFLNFDQHEDHFEFSKMRIDELDEPF